MSALIMAFSLSVLGGPADADDSGVDHPGAIQQQLDQIRSNQSDERQRIEQDERIIHQLEEQIQQLNHRHAALVHQTDTLEITSDKLKADTAQLQDTQKELAAGLSDEKFGSSMSRWLGSHQFTWNGAVAGGFIYDRGNNTNTFALTFEPLVIYRLNDWISFEGELEAALPQGSDAKFGLPIAMFQLFLNDYIQVNAGLFDHRFGD